LAFAYRVAKLKLFASISATDAKPQNVSGHSKTTHCENETLTKKLKIQQQKKF